MKTVDIPQDIAALGDDAVERYLSLLDSGQSESMAGILAARKSPGARTEATRTAAQNQQRGGATLADQFKGNENLMNYRIQQARKHGYSPRPCDYYDSSRAMFPGDPQAWTGSSQTLGDVTRTVKSRGHGMAVGDDVTLAPNTDVAPVPPKKLNDRIVNRIHKQMLKDDPGLAQKDQREVRSEIKHKHGNNEKDAVE